MKFIDGVIERVGRKGTVSSDTKDEGKQLTCDRKITTGVHRGSRRSPSENNWFISAVQVMMSVVCPRGSCPASTPPRMTCCRCCVLHRGCHHSRITPSEWLGQSVMTVVMTIGKGGQVMIYCSVKYFTVMQSERQRPVGQYQSCRRCRHVPWSCTASPLESSVMAHTSRHEPWACFIRCVVESSKGQRAGARVGGMSTHRGRHR